MLPKKTIKSNDNFTTFLQLFRGSLIPNSASSLSSQMVRTYWNNNPLLQQYYHGHPVNFGTTELPDIRTITFTELTQDFFKLIRTRTTEIIESVMNSNPTLERWLSNSSFPSSSPSISLDILSEYFKNSLTYNCFRLSKFIWHNNPDFQLYFSGLKNIHGEDIQHFSGPLLNSLSNNLICALSSKNIEISDSLWKLNPTLRSWFCGKEINIASPENPDFRMISDSALLNNFSRAIVSRSFLILDEMLSNNDRLNLILNDKTYLKQNIKIVKRFLTEIIHHKNHRGGTEFFNMIHDSALLLEAKKTIKPYEKHRKEKLKWLDKRLMELGLEASVHLSTFSTSEKSDKKRKVPDEVSQEQPPFKKRRTTPRIEAELSVEDPTSMSLDHQFDEEIERGTDYPLSFKKPAEENKIPQPAIRPSFLKDKLSETEMIRLIKKFQSHSLSQTIFQSGSSFFDRRRKPEEVPASFDFSHKPRG